VVEPSLEGFLAGKSSIDRPVSIAMLDYQRISQPKYGQHICKKKIYSVKKHTHTKYGYARKMTCQLQLMVHPPIPHIIQSIRGTHINYWQFDVLDVI